MTEAFRLLCRDVAIILKKDPAAWSIEDRLALEALRHIERGHQSAAKHAGEKPVKRENIRSR